MDSELIDRLAIRDVVENWAIWRDAGDWDRFASVWRPEGRMNATWFQGSYKDFIRVTQEGWTKGVSILHFLGGMSIEMKGDRAFVQTKMTISQRGPVEGVVCDVVCTGRFADFLDRRDGKWGFVLRQPIYEKDRVDPVDPSATISFDRDKLAKMPAGYRHLAYIQLGIGYDVKMDMPMLTGPAVEALYAAGEGWLNGGGVYTG